jgi:organic radical activating enzyme
MTDNNKTHVDRMVDVMQKVEKKYSPTMCTAKWLQSTTTLYNGFTHSCHHPQAHKIPLEELEDNPSALHNTNHKKELRQQMLDGKRPSECQYCWNIEDLPGNHMSDRTYKSTDFHWSVPFMDRIDKAGASGNIDPTYLEIAFDTTCNFKCMYCSASVSSKWMEEIEQHGPYPTSTASGDIVWLKKMDQMPIPNREKNPYIDAFWKWWPMVKDKLRTFRITGGEPLLSKHTWTLFEDIIKLPRPDLNLSINTNMDVPDVFISKLIEKNNSIQKNVKTFSVFTSCEAAGEQADYIRFGMKYDRFMGNVRKFLTETAGSQISFTITFNALSVTTFEKFLMDILQLRKEFNETNGFNRIPMMVAYLRWPNYQDVRVLPIEIRKAYAEKFKELVHANSDDGKQHGIFYLEEIDQIERLTEFMLSELPKLEQNRIDFGRFYTEYDFRRETDFKSTFPELADFFDECVDKDV